MPNQPAQQAPRRVIFDTDPGIDDALALALLLRSPELRLEAITTVSGNVHVDLCTRNALLVLETLELDDPPPVARGADRPLQRPPVDASHVHGEDGLGGITTLAGPGGKPRYPQPQTASSGRHAVDVILDIVGNHPGEITLIAVGPLTNVALAVERDRSTMRQLAELILMGGSLSGIGNVTPSAEFNFYADPLAARQVLLAGIDTTVVGLDVTQKTLLRKADLETRLAAAKAAGAGVRTAEFAADVAGHYFSIAESRTGQAACPLHDPLAVGVAIDPSFVRTEPFAADVETEGSLTTGMLVADRRKVNAPSELQGRIQGSVEVDADRFVRFFLDRLAPST